MLDQLINSLKSEVGTEVLKQTNLHPMMIPHLSMRFLEPEPKEEFWEVLQKVYSGVCLKDDLKQAFLQV